MIRARAVTAVLRSDPEVRLKEVSLDTYWETRLCLSIELPDKCPIRCSVVLQRGTKITCLWRARDCFNWTLIRWELRGRI
jgi:hypothetical protein